MGAVEGLIDAYRRYVELPWRDDLSGSERVWMAIYPPREERRLRMRLDQFATDTGRAGHTWKHVDITRAFGQWLGGHRYRDEYFANPQALQPALRTFGKELVAQVQGELEAADVDKRTVVGVTGVGALFGTYRASWLIEGVQQSIRGRLLVFFPGERSGNNYRLLDARDGWNYRAVPIEPSESST